MKFCWQDDCTSYIFQLLNWDKRCEMDFQFRIQPTVQTCNFGHYNSRHQHIQISAQNRSGLGEAPQKVRQLVAGG
jgi:hypothetical protein